jgi:hypothetical protein
MLQSVEVGPVIVQQFIKRRKVEPIAVTVSMFGLFDIFEDEVFFTGFLAVLAEGLFQVLAMLSHVPLSLTTTYLTSIGGLLRSGSLGHLVQIKDSKQARTA